MTSSSSSSDPILRIGGLIRARFKRRLNRFVGLVELDGREEEVHITNTGRLHDILVPGREVLLRGIGGGRLRYRLIAARDVEGLYSIPDVRTQSMVFERLLEQGRIPYLAGCNLVSRNPRVGGSMLDYLLRCGDREVLIETKSAVLRIGEAASYPDCPTTRGQRHVRELIRLVSRGEASYIIFISALPRVRCFKPYRDGDPEIYRLLGEALKAGVGVKAISIYMDSRGYVYLENPDLPLCRDWVEEL